MLYLFTVMEAVIIVIMFLIMFRTRFKGLKAVLSFILGTAAASAFTILVINLPLHIKTTLTVAAYTIACLCVFDIKWQNSLMISLLGCYELIACDTMAVVICSAFFLRKLDFNVPLKYSIILNIILLLLSFANLFFGQITSTVITALDHLQVVVMCSSYMIVMILVLVLFFNLCKYFSTEAELNYSNLKNDFLEQQLEQQKSAEKNIRTIKHDMLNHLYAIDYLKKSGETERFDSYMKTLISRTSVPFRNNITGIQMLDAILSLKYQVAKDNDASIKVNSTGVKHYPDVSEYCLSSIFANLLDNAIEGAGSADENDREITVDITENAGCLNARITNHYNENAQNDIIAAGKGHIHKGLGISIAKNAAEENKGMFEYTAENGIFTAMVVLPVSEKTIG